MLYALRAIFFKIIIFHRIYTDYRKEDHNFIRPLIRKEEKTTPLPALILSSLLYFK